MDFFFKISKHDFTFIREMRVTKGKPGSILTFLQYPMTLRQGPKDPVLSTLNSTDHIGKQKMSYFSKTISKWNS